MRHSDEALDALLDGPLPAADEVPLAAFLAAVRADAEATVPQPSEALAIVLSEGRAPGAAAAAPAPAWHRRARLAVRVAVAKFGALGLLVKTAAAGAAVTVAASGAGAAGVLPGPTQDTFDRVVGRTAPVEVEEERADDGLTDEAPAADTSTTPSLDRDVPSDATGDSDGEVGVDGGAVADDASDGRVEQAPPRPAPERPASGEDAVRDTPAPAAVPPTPTPPPASSAPERPAAGEAGSDERTSEEGAPADAEDGRAPSGTGEKPASASAPEGGDRAPRA